MSQNITTCACVARPSVPRVPCRCARPAPRAVMLANRKFNDTFCKSHSPRKLAREKRLVIVPPQEWTVMCLLTAVPYECNRRSEIAPPHVIRCDNDLFSVLVSVGILARRYTGPAVYWLGFNPGTGKFPVPGKQFHSRSRE